MEKKSEATKKIIEFGNIISGEKKLQEEREKLLKEKKKAREKQDSLIRTRIEGKNLKLEVDEDLIPDSNQPGKVIQNIKLFEWVAPRRTEIMFDMKNFLMIVGLALIFMLYLAILGNIALMGVIIALLFLVYVVGTTRPMKVKHRITARGIDTPISVEEVNDLDSEQLEAEVYTTTKENLFTSKLYEWYMLRDFCFYKKYDQYFLVVRTHLRIPAKLIMLISEEDIETIFMLLQDKVLYRDQRGENFITKMIDGEYISLEEI